MLVLWALTLPHFNQGWWQGDTAWYAALGVQGWRTGNLWTLYAEPGVPYFNKPPLPLWLHGLSLHLFGQSLWATRLPSILAATGCALAIVALARSRLPRWPSLVVGLAFVTSYDFFHRCAGISLDLWQCLFLLFAALAVARAAPRPFVAGFALAGACIGLALLCKPLVALLALPLFALWLAWSRRTRAIPGLLLTLVVAVAVAAPWHISMARLHGAAFTDQYLGREVIQRASGTNLPGHAEPVSPWFYVGVIATRYWPWLLAVPAGLVALFRRRLPPGAADLARFGAVWTAGWLVALSAFPDRRDRYDIPIYIGLAAIAGIGLARARGGLRRLSHIVAAGSVPALIVAGVVAALLPIRLYSPEPAHWRAFREWSAAMGHPPVWNGGCGAAQTAQVYLATGAWPRPPTGPEQPREGSLILYHRRGGQAPGSNESELLSSGDVRVTRLGPGGWHPRPAADPGEDRVD